MTTLTANSGTFSEALEVSEQATLVATSGYVQYTTGTLVEANQGRVVWQTWPLGAVAGTMYAIGRMVVRLAGTSDGATCVVTDPRTLIAADALARVEIAPEALLWADEDGNMYSTGNVLEGNAGGGGSSPVYPLTDVMTWVPHNARTGIIFASANFSINSAGYVAAPFTEARLLAWGYSTTLQWSSTGVILAPTTRLDQSAGTPGHWLTPTGSWVQMTVGGSATFSTPLSTTVNSQVQPNYMFGDWVDVQSAFPVSDTTNNPGNMYLFLNRSAGGAGGGYYNSSMPSDKTEQDTQRALVGLSSASFNSANAYFQSAAGLGVVGTTVNTGWGSPWGSGNGSNVGFQFRTTVPGVLVVGVGDSVMEGAFASDAGSGGGDYIVPYFETSVTQARTLGCPLFPVTLGYSGQGSPISSELATRFIDQVQVPGIIVLQPSRNDAWSAAGTTALIAVGDRIRDAGGYVIYVTPLPDTSAAGLAAQWDACRAAILAKSTDPRTYIADPAAAIGQGVSDRDPDPAFYRADGIHPSNLGHEQIRLTVVPHIRSAVAAIMAA